MQVPKLTACLLCTIVIGFPVNIYYVGFVPSLRHVERIVAIIMLVFLILETVCLVMQLRHLVRVSSRRYMLYFNRDGTLYRENNEMMPHPLTQTVELETIPIPRVEQKKTT